MIVASVGILTAFAETSPTTNPGGMTQEIKYPWESRAALGLTLTQGNSDTLMATASLSTQRKTPVNEYSAGIGAAYGKSDSVKNAESYSAFGQFNHLFSERLFGYVRADYLHDGVADLRYRVTLSPGVGYYFLKTTNTTLAAEVGPGVVFRDQGGDHEIFATLRMAERFEHKFDNGARVWQSLEFLPQVDKWENYIINAEVGGEASLTKSLSLQVVLTDTYNSLPAAGRKSNDLKLVSGIAYKF